MNATKKKNSFARMNVWIAGVSLIVAILALIVGFLTYTKPSPQPNASNTAGEQDKTTSTDANRNDEPLTLPDKPPEPNSPPVGGNGISIGSIDASGNSKVTISNESHTVGEKE
jgi:hypothetical protein